LEKNQFLLSGIGVNNKERLIIQPDQITSSSSNDSQNVDHEGGGDVRKNSNKNNNNSSIQSSDIDDYVNPIPRKNLSEAEIRNLLLADQSGELSPSNPRDLPGDLQKDQTLPNSPPEDGKSSSLLLLSDIPHEQAQNQSHNALENVDREDSRTIGSGRSDLSIGQINDNYMYLSLKEDQMSLYSDETVASVNNSIPQEKDNIVQNNFNFDQVEELFRAQTNLISRDDIKICFVFSKLSATFPDFNSTSLSQPPPSYFSSKSYNYQQLRHNNPTRHQNPNQIEILNHFQNPVQTYSQSSKNFAYFSATENANFQKGIEQFSSFNPQNGSKYRINQPVYPHIKPPCYHYLTPLVEAGFPLVINNHNNYNPDLAPSTLLFSLTSHPKQTSIPFGTHLFIQYHPAPLFQRENRLCASYLGFPPASPLRQYLAQAEVIRESMCDIYHPFHQTLSHINGDIPLLSPYHSYSDPQKFNFQPPIGFNSVGNEIQHSPLPQSLTPSVSNPDSLGNAGSVVYTTDNPPPRTDPAYSIFFASAPPLQTHESLSAVLNPQSGIKSSGYLTQISNSGTILDLADFRCDSPHHNSLIVTRSSPYDHQLGPIPSSILLSPQSIGSCIASEDYILFGLWLTLSLANNNSLNDFISSNSTYGTLDTPHPLAHTGFNFSQSNLQSKSTSHLFFNVLSNFASNQSLTSTLLSFQQRLARYPRVLFPPSYPPHTIHNKHIFIQLYFGQLFAQGQFLLVNFLCKLFRTKFVIFPTPGSNLKYSNIIFLLPYAGDDDLFPETKPKKNKKKNESGRWAKNEKIIMSENNHDFVENNPNNYNLSHSRLIGPRVVAAMGQNKAIARGVLKGDQIIHDNNYLIQSDGKLIPVRGNETDGEHIAFFPPETDNNPPHIDQNRHYYDRVYPLLPEHLIGTTTAMLLKKSRPQNGSFFEQSTQISQTRKLLISPYQQLKLQRLRRQESMLQEFLPMISEWMPKTVPQNVYLDQEAVSTAPIPNNVLYNKPPPIPMNSVKNRLLYPLQGTPATDTSGDLTNSNLAVSTTATTTMTTTTTPSNINTSAGYVPSNFISMTGNQKVFKNVKILNTSTGITTVSIGGSASTVRQGQRGAEKQDSNTPHQIVKSSENLPHIMDDHIHAIDSEIQAEIRIDSNTMMLKNAHDILEEQIATVYEPERIIPKGDCNDNDDGDVDNDDNHDDDDDDNDDDDDEADLTKKLKENELKQATWDDFIGSLSFFNPFEYLPQNNPNSPDKTNNANNNHQIASTTNRNDKSKGNFAFDDKNKTIEANNLSIGINVRATTNVITPWMNYIIKKRYRQAHNEIKFVENQTFQLGQIKIHQKQQKAKVLRQITQLETQMQQFDPITQFNPFQFSQQRRDFNLWNVVSKRFSSESKK
jgi:hypothetical protein